jgi:hypothetical protein
LFSLFIKEKLFVGEAVIATGQPQSSDGGRAWVAPSITALSSLSAFLLLLPPSTNALVQLSVDVVVGIIAGPYVTGGFDPGKWGGGEQEVTDEITLEVTRVVIAVSSAPLPFFRDLLGPLLSLSFPPFVQSGFSPR